MSFVRRAVSPFALSTVGCVSLLLLATRLFIDDEQQDKHTSFETSSTIAEPVGSGVVGKSAEREDLAISFTKPRSAGANPRQVSPSDGDLRATAAMLERDGDNSEVGHAIACMLRSNHEFRSKCEGTQLAAVASAVKADHPSYTFAGRQHEWGEQLGGLGLEFALYLHADAGVPLATLHRFLNGFDRPACIVVPSAIPAATQLFRRISPVPGGRDSTNLPKQREYEAWESITAAMAESALVFPAFAIRRDHDLEFRELTSLPPDAAAVLASHRHSIEFPALKEVSAEVAAALANHQGGNGATGIGEDNHLELGLVELSAEVAGALAHRKSGLLTLGNFATPLAALSAESGAALAKREGGGLELRVRDISMEAQDVIAGYRGHLSLRGGPRVLSSSRLVQKLCRDRYGDTLILNCSDMTPEAAEAFRDHGSGVTLMFTEPFRIDDKVAKILAAYEGEIQFHKLIAATAHALTTLSATAPAAQEPVATQANAGSLASASSANSGAADASMAGRESEQPGRRNEVIEAISPTFSGLLDFPFGISEQAVTARCPVELANVEDQDGTFEGSGLKSLVAMRFPVTETDNLPVEFVLRDDSLIGMRVLIGYVTPDAFGGFVSSLATRLGKGQPEGSTDDYRDAAIRFSEGKPHAPLRVAFNRRRTLVALTWNEKHRKSVSEVIFRENWEPLDPVRSVTPGPKPTTTVQGIAADTAARSHDAPLDYGGLTSLSVQQAAQLAKQFGELSLPSLHTITPEPAEALVVSNGRRRLVLSGLTELSPDVATHLSRVQGELRLDGLQSLPEEVAAELSKCRYDLSLNGVLRLSPAAARRLAQHESHLYLNGLSELDEQSALELAPHSFDLHLNGLKSLTPAAAIGLATKKGSLFMNGATHLSSESIGAIAGPKRWELHLDGIRELTPRDAAALAEGLRQGGPLLSLNGVTSLSEDVARTLAFYRGSRLRLNGVRTIPVSVAEALSVFKGELELDGVQELTGEAAEALCGGPWSLSLNGVSSITPQVAKAIGARQKHVSLNGLQSLSDADARALFDGGVRLNLDGLREISVYAAKLLARHEADVTLNGIRHLSDEVAMELAMRDSDCWLNGVAALSPSVAKILGQGRSSSLQLDGLTELTVDAAAGLIYRGPEERRLKLNGLKDMPSELALVLVLNKGPLELDGVKHVADEVAEILARHKDSVSLGGVTHLSDKASSAFANGTAHFFLGGLTSLSDSAQKEWERAVAPIGGRRINKRDSVPWDSWSF